VTEPVDDRSATAQALSKASQVTSISLMMIIPAIIGYFIDQRLNTLILFTALGLMIGMAGAIWQLVQFVKFQDRQSDTDGLRKSSDEKRD
jgi:F0F1-type ATP synthase assembly protein I